MPLKDRHRPRVVPIEFEENQSFDSIPLEERVTLILVTDGNASMIINAKAYMISAPCVLCISQYDQITEVSAQHLSVKLFHFNPIFLNSSLTFEALAHNKFTHLEDQHDRNLLKIFLTHSDKFQGIIPLQPSMFLRINEWMDVIAQETSSQSDGMWTCRIRRYLLQTLYLIDDVYTEMVKSRFCDTPQTKKEHLEIALEYIHINYQNDFSLDDLCRFVNLNRTSLNRRFKEKTGHTAMNYLIHYRIKIACETLTHTNLKMGELAEACGFKYDTYFIKQFTKKMGISPTEYRQNERKRREEERSNKP